MPWILYQVCQVFYVALVTRWILWRQRHCANFFHEHMSGGNLTSGLFQALGTRRRSSPIVDRPHWPRAWSLTDIFMSVFLQRKLLVMAGEERVMAGERLSICWDPGLITAETFYTKGQSSKWWRPSILVSRLPHPLPQLSLKSLIPLVTLKWKRPNCKQ